MSRPPATPNNPAWQSPTAEQPAVRPPQPGNGTPVFGPLPFDQNHPGWGVTEVAPTTPSLPTAQAPSQPTPATGPFPSPKGRNVRSHRQPEFARKLTTRIAVGLGTLAVLCGAYAVVEHFTHR